MTYEEAVESAKTISRTYGETSVFREPGPRESYQAMAGSFPVGATIMANFHDGKQTHPK